MIAGVPKETFPGEKRVAQIPAGLLVRHLVCSLSLQILHLQYHFRGDRTFLIEQGVRKALLDGGPDFPGDPEGHLMDRLQGLGVEQGFRGSGEFQVMSDIVFSLLEAQGGQMIAHGDPLVEGFHDSKLQEPSQVGLTGQDQDEGVIGVHLEVCKQPQLLQGPGLKQVGFIQDQDHGLAHLFLGFQERFLDLRVDGAL